MGDQQFRDEVLKKQGGHILSNISKLVDMTELNPQTIAAFLQNRVLGSGDIAKLNAVKDKYKRNMVFYQIIVNRSGFYEVLMEAMEKTCQTGVVELLKRLDMDDTVAKWMPSHFPGRDDSPLPVTGAVIVGGKECPISKVTSILTSTEFLELFNERWSQIARELDTPPHKISQIRQSLLVNTLQLSDAVVEIVQIWVGASGEEASLQELIRILKGNGMRNCAEALEKAFLH